MSAVTPETARTKRPRAARRMYAYGAAFASSKRHRGDLVGWLVRRPLIALATGIYEMAMLLSNRLDPHLKELAELKTAGMVSCEFCLDIGSALARSAGVTESQIRDLPVYAESAAYSDVEKLVISFAEAMTVTPASHEGLAEIRDRLAEHLSKTQIAELAATVAWENQRARLNQSLGIRATGMSDGATCALPETRRDAP